MDVRIRNAEPGEDGALLGLYEGLFAPPGRRPGAWDTKRAGAALAEAIAAEGSAVFVAELGGEPIGLCSAYLDLNSVRFGLRCWVEDLVVATEHRSRGAGGALLDAAEDWARARGATHLELDTGLDRTDAQRFYRGRDPAAVGYSYSWPL